MRKPGVRLKRAAAAKALEFVTDGQRLGLGTGSTAAEFVALLGEKVAAGLNVICVPTSEVTRAQAEHLNIPLTTLDDTPQLDLTIDGADEIGPELALIKGGGGALLREKIVANASARMIVIADETKRVDMLGAFPLPVEVIPFGCQATVLALGRALESAGVAGEIVRRKDARGKLFTTDSGNFIYDCHLERIPAPALLADALANVPGLVEHGLFIGMCDTAIIASRRGAEIVDS
jgi:ribose 5-phosphate isomerase A